jgi:CHAT domain-containing protein
LPGARAELAALADLHAGSISLCADAFDREAMQRALRGGRPLHVATHLVPGCFSRSRLAGVGMVLSGGELFCPAEVREAAPRLPLVVLSGCESQGGRFVDAEGLHGVARAFLESGTRNLLVTLWPVEDGAAKAFALAFHRELAAGALPSHAARAARATVARRHPAAEWAAFRLSGRD